jgi:transcriptional regulator with XRE-family HTH domain
VLLGAQVHDERAKRHWTLRELAARAGLSAAAVQAIEAGRAGSVEAAARLAEALGLRLNFELIDPRRRQSAGARLADPVHSAMGELEAGHLRRLSVAVAMDEPYQHFQFAGRADLIGWDIAARALLHIENRTRFPDLQETAGSFNAKRAYLGRVLADRLNIDRWRSETHVMVALWSAEVMHVLRLRTETFRALCPDQPAGFARWWQGTPPTTGKRRELVIIDPLAGARQRAWVGLDEALTARSRHRGYADVARLLLDAA